MADLRLPRPVQGGINRAFARLVGVDLAEAAGAPEDYPSLSAFFSRPLRPGARAFPPDPLLPASPVDGVVGACGRVASGVVLQAKGFPYSVAELLGDRDGHEAGDPAQRAREPREEWARSFEGGFFLTIYLSPRHYHRIHAPVGGGVVIARALPGRLLPVNLPAVRTIRDLFPRNERLVAMMESAGLRVALVAVGAMNVGRISAAFDPGWSGSDGRGVTNRRGRGAEERRYPAPIEVRRGDELMAFHLGSTVVLLFAPEPGVSAEFVRGLEEGAEIRVGAPLLEVRRAQPNAGATA